MSVFVNKIYIYIYVCYIVIIIIIIIIITALSYVIQRLKCESLPLGLLVVAAPITIVLDNSSYIYNNCVCLFSFALLLFY